MKDRERDLERERLREEREREKGRVRERLREERESAQYVDSSKFKGEDVPGK